MYVKSLGKDVQLISPTGQNQSRILFVYIKPFDNVGEF